MPKSYYPPVSLKETLRIPRAIVEKGGRGPMFRVRLAEELDVGPEGNKFGALITASKGYGLTEGSRTAQKIELRERGARIIRGETDALFEALMSVEPFSAFYDQYHDSTLPTEGVIEDFLLNNCGIPLKQTKHVCAAILRDGQDWGVIQDRAGGQRVVPLEMARDMTAAQIGAVAAPPPERAKSAPAGKPQEEHPERRAVEIEPSLQLNIAIHIAPDTPEDKIEVIFRNMKKYLLPNE